MEREKETWGGWWWWGGAEMEIERELRPVEIDHDVRHRDTLQPQIHHRNRVCRRNWTTGEKRVDWKRSGAGTRPRDTGEDGGRGLGGQIGYHTWAKPGQKPVRAAKAFSLVLLE